MTQHDLILEHMRTHGSITTIEAFSQYGITKLTTRISELRRAGFLIRHQTYSEVNRYGKLVTYNRYWLVEDKENKAGSVTVG